MPNIFALLVRLFDAAFLWLTRHRAPYAAVLYVVRGGMVLSVSRKGSGLLAAPGGHVDPGDLGSGERTVRRELREEAGVEALTVEKVYRGRHRLRVVEAFLGTIADDAEPRAVEPGTRVAWVTPADLAKGYAPEFHGPALRAAGFDA